MQLRKVPRNIVIVKPFAFPWLLRIIHKFHKNSSRKSQMPTEIRLEKFHLMSHSGLIQEALFGFWQNVIFWHFVIINVIFIPFFFVFCFESLGQQGYENTKILCNLCIHFARQDRKKRKEHHATKVTKIPKTKRQKYGTNKTQDYF